MTTARYFVSRSFRAENKFPREFSKDLLKSIDFYFLGRQVNLLPSNLTSHVSRSAFRYI